MKDTTIFRSLHGRMREKSLRGQGYPVQDHGTQFPIRQAGLSLNLGWRATFTTAKARCRPFLRVTTARPKPPTRRWLVEKCQTQSQQLARPLLGFRGSSSEWNSLLPRVAKPWRPNFSKGRPTIQAYSALFQLRPSWRGLRKPDLANSRTARWKHRRERQSSRNCAGVTSSIASHDATFTFRRCQSDQRRSCSGEE